MAMTEENSTTKQKNELHQLRYEVETCIHNLCEYLGHLARQTAEEEKAMQELEDLLDNEALVICDYKMKILACYFRENQKKFFGKRGTTTFGSMIVTNPEDVELKTKGVKDVSFVMLVTNDSLQDDWAVVCAKCYIYKECLPKHIKKVIFVADGAGCFKSKLHRAIQGFWKYWTGIEEIKYRITPAGDGKTCLDGMFGRMSVILSTAVDNGASFYNMESILETISKSNGMSSTKFLGYAPDRRRELSVNLTDTKTSFSGSFLTTVLASDCKQSNNILSKAFKHSGYGSGKTLNCSYFSFSVKEDDRNESILFYDKEVSFI